MSRLTDRMRGTAKYCGYTAKKLLLEGAARIDDLEAHDFPLEATIDPYPKRPSSMHTTKIKGTTFRHNGGFDGDIEIIREGEGMLVPFEDIKELVAKYIRMEQINMIENYNANQVLGIRCD